MNFTCALLDNVKHIKMLTATATYGIGLLTAIVNGFCQLFGIQCKMYDKKIEKAKNAAVNQLLEKATAAGASGVMGINFQVYGTTVFMYGIAYKE